jgi:hypothetical protein
MAGMKISVDAAMRARDVSRPQDEAADAPAAGQGADPVSAASGGQPGRGQPGRAATTSKQTSSRQANPGQANPGQNNADQANAGQTAAGQADGDGTNGHRASTNRASRALPATQFRPKKRSRRRGR